MSGRCVTPRLWQNLGILKQMVYFFMENLNTLGDTAPGDHPKCRLFPAFYSRDSAKKSKREGKNTGVGVVRPHFSFSLNFAPLSNI